MQSYFIKTALIHAARDEPDWRQEKIGIQLVALMRHRSEALKNGELQHPFVKEWNILTDYSEIHRENLHSRIDRVLNSKNQLQKILAV